MISRIGAKIWESKYRYAHAGNVIDNNPADTWSRVARAVGDVESERDRWYAEYRSAISELRFLPGGRVLAGAGTENEVTLFNCFVSGELGDSIEAILESLKETALTMQQGGGIGVDFSGLRPAGSDAVRTGSVASGPVSFMHLWDVLCETLLATSSRRGAMMGTLRCDHPDIFEFVNAKCQPDALKNFNLSVLVSDDFMDAVHGDHEWQLVQPADGALVRRVPARELWLEIIHAAHNTGEPGLLFIDRINRENNLYYCERISSTNPCGEVPLPPYGACNLGSINLTAFVNAPFTRNARIEHGGIRSAVRLAVRFLDAVIDVSGFPLEPQAKAARNTRRIGLGITGLADALAMVGRGYDSDEGRELAAGIMESIRDTAYETSVALAREKGAFPQFDRDRYLDASFIRRLPGPLRDGIAAGGIRNSHLLAIAPAGTISLLAGNVSGGIEPIYALQANRDIRAGDGRPETLTICDFAYELWLKSAPLSSSLPDAFVTAEQLPARAHLSMQACLQPYVDSAISKTINLAPAATVEDLAAALDTCYAAGIKGCTVFRSGSGRGQVLRGCNNSQCAIDA